MNENENKKITETEETLEAQRDAAFAWYCWCQDYYEATKDGKEDVDAARDEYRRLLGLPPWEWRLRD